MAGKLMHKLFLSCLKATELIEKKLQVKLSLKEKLQLTMHKMMCDACSAYDKQSLLLDHGIRESGKKIYYEMDVESLKQAIHKKLSRDVG